MLLKETLKGASDAGADVKFIRLREFDILPCIECLSCHKEGKCVIEDDMQMFYSELIDMDAIILGSPIFFMGVTAWGKAFIDRCQPFWAMKYLLKKAFIPKERIPRKGAFISVGGTKLAYLFDGAIRVVKSFFKVTEVAYRDELLLKGIDEKGEILKYPEALKLSYKLGTRITKSTS